MLLWLRLAVAALALVAVPLPAANEQQLDSLRKRIERLRDEIAGGEEFRAEARDQLRTSERAISEANRVLRELARQRDSARKELRSLAEREETANAEIAARREQLARLLTAHYKSGERTYLKLLMMGENPNQVARKLQYYSYISRAQADFIQSLRGDLEQLRSIKARTIEKTTEISMIESRQKTERERLVEQRAERRSVLARVSAQLRDQRREVKSLETDEKRLARLVDRLTRVIAEPLTPNRRNELVPEPRTSDGGEHDSFTSLKGKLRLPIKGELVNRFGARRSEGGPQWKGLFIRSAPGQEVRVVAAGRVVFADWLRGFGNLLIVDHGEDYLTIYGSNESVFKAVGDQVQTGDVVATVGATGGSTESGLYFEIRRQGKPFDPLKWVSLE